jgi:iron complex outermembrane receptor protein
LISDLLRQRAVFSGLLAALLLVFCTGSLGTRLSAAQPNRTFALAAGDAEFTLEKFSEQAGVQIVYLLGDVRGVTTNAVEGVFAIRDALDQLVDRTALKVEMEGRTGAFVIKRERTPRSSTKGPKNTTHTTPMKKSASTRLVAALVALTSSALVAQNAPSTTTAEAPVVLTPFSVSASQDKGYRASNSVSGSRIDTPIKDLPFALQAFTADFIADINPHELFDIVRFSPGVTTRSGDFTGGNSGNFSIRGFPTGANPLRNGFAGPPLIDSVNIARVEVVKGPASFLYGQLSPGGLVNIITKKPLAVRQTTFRQEFGSDEYLRTQVDTTGPLGNTNVFYRLAGAWQNDFMYYDPYEAQQWDIAPSALWRITPNMSLSVEYEHFEKHEDPMLMMIPNIAFPTPAGYPYSQYIGPAYPVPQQWNSADYADYRDSWVDNVVVNYEAKLGEHWSARAAYAYIFRNIEMFAHGNFSLGNTATTNAGDIPATATLPAILQKNAMGRRPRLTEDDGYQHTYTAESTGLYQFGGVSARILFGYQNDTVRSNSGTWQAPVPTWPRPWDLSNPATWDRNAPKRTKNSADLPLTGASRADVDIEAYWVGLTLGFFEDRLTVLGGTRHTETVNKSYNKISGVRNPIFEREADTPQIGALYKITNEISLFASSSESFVPNNTLLRILGVATTPAEPTVGKGWDVGVKTSLKDGRISGTLSFYEVKNTNIIQNVVGFAANGDTVFTDFQSGEQESKGVELDVVFSPTDNFQVYAAYSHQNPIYTVNPAFPVLEGKPLEGSTKNLASMWAKYRFTHEGVKGVYVAGGFTWQDKQQTRLENPDLYFDAYALFDLQVGYDFKWHGRPCTIELAGKNLANESYLPSNNSRGLQRRFILSFSTRL